MKTAQLLLFLFFVCNFGFAQEVDKIDGEEQTKKAYQLRKNLVKMNATSLILRNFQFQYERVLNKTFSVGLSYSFIPEGDFPFKDLVLKSVDDAEDVSRYIENAQLEYSSFTPEIRMYIGGNGYGKGFYIAPFYRHSNYSVKNIQILYDSEDGIEQMLDTSGDLKTDTFGLLIGVQFNLGSRLVLDWFILGPNYGTSDGKLTGIAEQPFTESEQQDLWNELDGIDLPIGDFNYEVNSEGAKITIGGAWGGIRTGIALGFRF